MNPRTFREYDIRGVAEADFPDAFVAELGHAMGSHFRARGCKTVTLGQDCRLTSPRIAQTLRGGLLAEGIDVIDVGVLHSPGLYFSVFHLQADGGVMVTASHNPAPDNGFKIVRGRTTIHGKEIQELRQRVEGARAGNSAPAALPAGTTRNEDILSPYITHIASDMRIGPRRPRVVVDGGNGTGGIACVPLLQRLGFDVDPLFCDPDGNYPNHHPDPTVPDNLRALIQRVGETGAELGIALDGDGDRIGVVDKKGRIVWGDQLMILFARDILKHRPGATFISEVKCSQTLFDQIAAAGGRAIMWKVGHSLIKEKLKEENAVLAGEMSGHMFFADRYFGFDDAVYAAARLMELLSNSDKTLADMVDTLPAVYNTPEIRIDCPDEIKFEVVARTAAWYRDRQPVNEIDGARISFPGGWGLVRASNTGPVLVLRCEAASQTRLDEIKGQLSGQLALIRAAVEQERV